MNDHLAKEAARLQADGVLNKAFDDIRAEALEALSRADAGNKITILRHQQKVAVIDEIRTTLASYIIAADVQEDAGSFA